MNEKLAGMLLGVALTVGVLLVSGLVMAHGNDNTIESNHAEMTGHMDMSSGVMMHGIHHDEDDGYDVTEHMENCPMMRDVENHEELTTEEMDQDGDGLCDMCGMPVEECLDMGSSMMSE